MANEYYTPSGWPGNISKGSSSTGRGEMVGIEAGFNKLPTLAANGDNLVSINISGNAVTSLTAAAARTLYDLVIGTDVQAFDTELQAFVGVTWVNNDIPNFTGSGTVGSYTFIDEDSMATNSATHVSSQQSIKAYIDGLVNTRTHALDGPTGTRAYFYSSSVPTGWTIVTGLDSRAVFVHATLGGTTVGTNAPNASHSTSTQSANHTHSLVQAVTTGSAQGGNERRSVGGGTSVREGESAHWHGMSFSTTSSIEDTGHNHSFSAFYGMYMVMGNKT